MPDKTIEVYVQEVDGSKIKTAQGATYTGTGKVENFINKQLEGQRVTLHLKNESPYEFTFLQTEQQAKSSGQNNQAPSQGQIKKPSSSGAGDVNTSYKMSYAKDIVCALINVGAITSSGDANSAMSSIKQNIDELWK